MNASDIDTNTWPTVRCPAVPITFERFAEPLRTTDKNGEYSTQSLDAGTKQQA
jgi:hypothetical protein